MEEGPLHPCLVTDVGAYIDPPAMAPDTRRSRANSVTATALNTVTGASAAQAANVNIQYSTNQPFLAGTSGSSLAGTAAATLLAATTLHVPVIVRT